MKLYSSFLSVVAVIIVSPWTYVQGQSPGSLAQCLVPTIRGRVWDIIVAAMSANPTVDVLLGIAACGFEDAAVNSRNPLAGLIRNAISAVGGPDCDGTLGSSAFEVSGLLGRVGRWREFASFGCCMVNQVVDTSPVVTLVEHLCDIVGHPITIVNTLDPDGFNCVQAISECSRVDRRGRACITGSFSSCMSTRVRRFCNTFCPTPSLSCSQCYIGNENSCATFSPIRVCTSVLG